MDKPSPDVVAESDAFHPARCVCARAPRRMGRRGSRHHICQGARDPPDTIVRLRGCRVPWLGALTANRRILWVQALPGAIALALVLAS